MEGRGVYSATALIFLGFPVFFSFYCWRKGRESDAGEKGDVYGIPLVALGFLFALPRRMF